LDTDYLLVPEERGGQAAEVLKADGWTVLMLGTEAEQGRGKVSRRV